MLPITPELRAALTGPALEVDYGADLLDEQDRVVEDLSPDLVSFSVARDLYADVHGSCTLQLHRDLRWGVDRVRPWVSVDGHAWPLGVFIPTGPDVDAGEEPRTRDVTGVDKLWLLQRQVGDTYVIQAGTSYLDAIRAVLTDAGLVARLLLQGDRQDTALTDPAVWPLAGYTWLDVVNGLLGSIAYRSLWVDEEGQFRSEPYTDPAEAGPVWDFDTTDQSTTIMGEDRSLSADVYDAPNRWVFVRKMDREPTVANGDIYIVDRSAGEPYVRPRVEFLDVVDAAALQSEGDRIVAEDTHSVRVVKLACSLLPLTHGDVVTVTDPGLGLFQTRGVVRRWSVSSDGAQDVEVELL